MTNIKPKVGNLKCQTLDICPTLTTHWRTAKQCFLVILMVQHQSLDISHWATGIGHQSLDISHWASGISHLWAFALSSSPTVDSGIEKRQLRVISKKKKQQQKPEDANNVKYSCKYASVNITRTTYLSFLELCSKFDDTYVISP